MSLTTKLISKITRNNPTITNTLRKLLPLKIKRMLGKYLLSKENESSITETQDFKFITIPDRVFLQVIYDGVFEPSLTNFIGKFIKNDDTCIDVGANFGWFTVYMGSKCNRVIAFEPAQRIFKILEKNVHLNNLDKKIECKKIAVGNEIGEITFVIEGDAKSESALGYVISDENMKNSNTNTETVNITTLDNELKKFIGKIALMKIDTEGFEYNTFLGSKKLLNSDNPPIIITEANRETLGRAGSNRKELCSTLIESNYTLYGISTNGEIYPDDETAPALVGIPSKGIYKDRAKTIYEH